MSRPPTTTVWVGNIPFDTTEAEVHALLAQIGSIKNFRLIMDRDTGKPKGFGFCEFHSKEDAESAYRNLNNTMFKNRQIRIDFAEENISDRVGYKPRGEGGRELPGGGLPPRGPGYPPIGMAAAQQSAAQVSSLLGGTPASDRRIQDMLNDLLANKSRAELWEVMRMLKNFLGGDKEAAKQFFAERPGLTKAVFQTQVLLGMVKPLAPGAFAPPGFPSAAQPPPPRRAAGGPLGLQALPPGAVPAPSGQMAQVIVMDPVTGQPQTVMVPADQLGTLGTVQQGPAQAILQPGGPVSLPGQPLSVQPEGLILQQQPVQQLTMQPLAAQQPAPAAVQPQMQAAAPAQQQQAPGGGAGGLLAGQDPQQMQTLLRQVMAMGDEQISALPEQFKQQVLYVKEQIRLGAVRIE